MQTKSPSRFFESTALSYSSSVWQIKKEEGIIWIPPVHWGRAALSQGLHDDSGSGWWSWNWNCAGTVIEVFHFEAGALFVCVNICVGRSSRVERQHCCLQVRGQTDCWDTVWWFVACQHNEFAILQNGFIGVISRCIFWLLGPDVTDHHES